MTELTIGVNWLAVMAGAVIAYLVGGAWETEARASRARLQTIQN